MVTLYDLLEIKDDASKDEIEASYKDLIVTYSTNPSLSEQENKENELILSKLKMAYDILIDDAKRKAYDDSLAKKKAEALLQNVTIKQEPEKKVEKEEITYEDAGEEFVETNEIAEISGVSSEPDEEKEVTLSNEDKKKLREAAQNEFKANLKRAQQAEQEYKQAYNKAYNDYLKKMGYQSKEPMTLKKVKNIFICIIAVVITCALIWIIPPTRNMLIGIYEENFIVKSLVDIFLALINAILSIFK